MSDNIISRVKLLSAETAQAKTRFETVQKKRWETENLCLLRGFKNKKILKRKIPQSAMKLFGHLSDLEIKQFVLSSISILKCIDAIWFCLKSGIKENSIKNVLRGSFHKIIAHWTYGST